MSASRGALRRPVASLLYALDHARDVFVLPMCGKVWRLEGRMRGASIEAGSIFGRPVFRLHPRSEVVVERNVVMMSDQRRVTSGSLYAPCRIQTHSASASIHIGAGVGLNGTSIVARSHLIHIGKGTMVAPNCVIMDSPYHQLWPPDARLHYPGDELDADVYIGSNCWIGAGSMILPGSRIGDNSVVGARSVVSGEIPPSSLAVGAPARVVRRLDE